MKLLKKIYNFLSNSEPIKPIFERLREHKVARTFINCEPEFLKWAFGPTHDMQTVEGKMYSWNNLHGELFIVEQIDHLHDKLPEMAEEWTKHVASKK